MGDNYDDRCQAIYDLAKEHLPDPTQPIPRTLWERFFIAATGLSHVSIRALTSHGEAIDLWKRTPGNRAVPGFVTLRL